MALAVTVTSGQWVLFVVAIAFAVALVALLKGRSSIGWKRVAVACALTAAFGGVVTLAARRWFLSHNVRRVLPGEYLYLDSDRVDAYLGQLSNGLSSSEKRSATSTLKHEASAGAGDAVKVGISAEESQTTEATVSPTATDRFYTLLVRLKTDFADSIRTVDPTEPFAKFSDKVKQLHEGDFIEIDNARLQVPTYAVLLPKIAFAARELLSSEFYTNKIQPNVTRRSLAQFISEHPGDVNRYLKPLGPDPRIPALVRAQVRGEPGNSFTFFVPLSYAQLVDAPALVSGNITVVGKVIRRVDGVGTGKIEDFRDHDYYDVEAATAFTTALKRSTPALRHAVHVPQGEAHPELFVDPSVTVSPHAMVVLPIAIYK